MTTLLPHRWSVEDYHCIVATGVLAEYSCELIRGEIIDMSPEGPLHPHRCETAARYLEKLFLPCFPFCQVERLAILITNILRESSLVSFR